MLMLVQHLVELDKENTAKLTELWCRIIFAVVPFVFVLVYGIVAEVDLTYIGKDDSI